MCAKFYLSLRKQQLKYPFLVILALTMFSSVQVNAQYHRDPWLHYGGGGSGNASPESGYAITFGTEYDEPLGGLASSFKGAPSFNFNVINYRGNFTFNAGIGYRAYQPKADTSYYDDGSGGQGTIVYQSFPVYSFYCGVAYNVDLTQSVRAYFGLNFGYYFTRYAFQANDQFSSTSFNLNEEDAYFAPKFGFNAMLSSSIGLGLEAKYNIFSPSGNSEDDPLVGTVLKSYAVGLVLTVKL